MMVDLTHTYLAFAVFVVVMLYFYWVGQEDREKQLLERIDNLERG